MPSAYDVAILEVDPSADLGTISHVLRRSGRADGRHAAGLCRLSDRGHRRAEHSPSSAPTRRLQFGRVTALSDYFLFNADARECAAGREQPAGHRRRQRQPDHRCQRQGGGGPERRHGRLPRWRAHAQCGDAQLRAARRPDRRASSIRQASTWRRRRPSGRRRWRSSTTTRTRSSPNARAALEEKTGRPGRRTGQGSGIAEDQRGDNDAGPSAIANMRSRSLPGTATPIIAYGDYDGTLNLMLLRDGKGSDRRLWLELVLQPDLHCRSRRDADAEGARPGEAPGRLQPLHADRAKDGGGGAPSTN